VASLGPAQRTLIRRLLPILTVEHQPRKRMVQPKHIAVLLLAACLTGCGGYSMFESDTTTSFTSSGKQAEWMKGAGRSSAPDAATPETAGSTSASSPALSDKTDTAALSSLFARAAAGKLNAGPASPAPAAKSVTNSVAIADASDTAIPVESAPGVGDKITTQPRGRAYLFRGVAGMIYSRGIDKLAERIKRIGITASVQTYLMWQPVAGEAIRDYRRDPAPITIIGHSMGGDSALSLAETLNAADIPVSLLVTYDPTRIADDVPPNVERYINLFQSSNFMGGGNVVQGQRFHGHYASFNLKNHSEIVHINIEKADRIQEQLVAKIVQLAATPASAEGEAVPLHLEVPTDASIELWDSGLPVSAHAGDTLKTLAATYHVPLWSLAEINSVSDHAPLAEGQLIVVPRHLAPMATSSTVTSYAPTGR
jgi:hypothetical protein